MCTRDYLLRDVIRNQENRVDQHGFTDMRSLLRVTEIHWDSPEIKPTVLHQYLYYASKAMKR